MSTSTGTSFAGDIAINELTIICSGRIVDLSPYFLELNLYEDIFSTCMSGDIYMTDPNGLVKSLPIIGEEYLTIDFVTPGSVNNIRKTFRVYKIENKAFYTSDRIQSFQLHFSASEVFMDSLVKIYRTFSGSVEQVAQNIFNEYIQSPRSYEIKYDDSGSVNGVVESKEQTLLNTTTTALNTIKFNSNGWGAVKCLSWLASKMIASETKTADVLFFETNQNYYLSSISEIIKYYRDNKLIVGDYYMNPKNIRDTNTPIRISGASYVPPDIGREYKLVESMNILGSFDTLDLTQKGFYASRQIQFDIVNKTYRYNDYDYIDKFNEYPHLDNFPLFSKTQFRTPVESVSISFSHPKLYNGITENANERDDEISQNRNSILMGLNCYFRVEISVPGRSDLECGSVIYFQMPDTGAKDSSDSVVSSDNVDTNETGLYLISAIRHKITRTRYLQTLEIVRDAIKDEYK
jgi:hypothetical protein